MTNISKEMLDALADKYETREFIETDPVKFPRRFFDDFRGNPLQWYRNVEIAAIIASWMAYGSRKVFIKITRKNIMDVIGDNPAGFILDNDDGFRVFANKGHKALYRFYTYAHLTMLCARLKEIYSTYSTINSFIMSFSGTPLEALIYLFKGVPGFPKNTKFACKRLCMLLRWMSRVGSEVDIGMWNIDTSALTIPLDTHVMRISRMFGLTNNRNADMRNAVSITEQLRIFNPKDPTRYDFAIYGLGVDEGTGEKKKQSVTAFS